MVPTRRYHSSYGESINGIWYTSLFSRFILSDKRSGSESFSALVLWWTTIHCGDDWICLTAYPLNWRNDQYGIIRVKEFRTVVDNMKLFITKFSSKRLKQFPIALNGVNHPVYEIIYFLAIIISFFAHLAPVWNKCNMLII